MKVKELAEIVEEGTYFNVEHGGKWLDGDYPVDFLECELEIKNIFVSSCSTMIVETKKKMKFRISPSFFFVQTVLKTLKVA